ncbi:MAG: DUF1697 domain-containing protein [Flavobacteriia bacterium]|nr:DUF1697 domain-containing protein [Flavobacteriia bacterium]
MAEWQKFVVFLRGINVSGKNIIKMEELKKQLSAAGFSEVLTYIQSGNIVFNSLYNKEETERKVSELIKERFQLDIPVFVLSSEDLTQALANNPFSADSEPSKLFFTFLKGELSSELLEKLRQQDHGEGVFHLEGNVLYFYLPEGMARSIMNNNYFEKKLKITATGRNLNTVNKMMSMI